MTQATNDLDAFKAVAGNDALQAVLDKIAQSQIALDHATINAAYTMHRCITDTQKAHYDKKVTAEKEMWGYAEMSDSYKKIFDDYIAKWTAFHQEQDAKVKEETGYYTMTDAEKQMFDKLHV